MKYLRQEKIKKILSYMFKAYIGWSICADLIIISGIIYLILVPSARRAKLLR